MQEEIKEIEIQVSINQDINEASFILAPKSAQNMNEIYAAHLEEKIGNEIKLYKRDVECALDIVRNSEEKIKEFEKTIEESKTQCENAEEKSDLALNTANNCSNQELSNLSEEGQAKLDAKLDKSGDTMTGELTIEGNYPYLNFKDIDTDSSVAPSTFQSLGSVFIRDKNEQVTGYLQNSVTTQNLVQTTIGARRRINGTELTSSLALAVDGSGNILFAFPMCTTKPTTTSSARGNKVAVVTQNYLNGTSWYRVWSDGFCEQGGSFTSSASTHTVSLLKSFSGTNYTVNLTLNLGGGTPTVNNYCQKKETSKITFYMESSGRGALWEARGYIN